MHKRIFALRPFAPRRLPSPPLRHGMAFRVSTACRIQARVARTTCLRLAHAKSGPQQLLRTRERAMTA